MRYRPHRHASDVPAVLKTPLGEIGVVVINVSRSGLRVRGPRMVPKNTPIKLNLRGEVMTGRIVWTNAQSAGVALEADLTARQMAMLRRLCVSPGRPVRRPSWAQTAGLQEMR